MLLYARDPGAANQLVAVQSLFATGRLGEVPALVETIGSLTADRDTMLAMAKDFAVAVWTAAGLVAEDWNVAVPEQLTGEARNAKINCMLRERGVTAVVTGVDDVDDHDSMALWQVARSLGLPSIALLDSHHSPQRRFVRQTGAAEFPDWVVAQDAGSVAALIALGLPATRLRLTDNLHLARLARMAISAQGSPTRRALRQSWDASDAEYVVLFASENTREMAAAGRPGQWDELALVDALAAHLKAARAIGPIPSGAPCRLVIRPHPRDTVGKYESRRRAGEVPIVVSAAGTPIDAILAADLIAGMDSSLLYEAQSLGQAAIALTPASRFPCLIDLTRA
ncbi:MAG: hypothetical protein HY985_12570 [Magnetospirillum sp.]|nr:hypothetical protein [Magnetospirillum sp.]